MGESKTKRKHSLGSYRQFHSYDGQELTEQTYSDRPVVKAAFVVGIHHEKAWQSFRGDEHTLWCWGKVVHGLLVFSDLFLAPKSLPLFPTIFSGMFVCYIVLENRDRVSSGAEGSMTTAHQKRCRPGFLSTRPTCVQVSSAPTSPSSHGSSRKPVLPDSLIHTLTGSHALSFISDPGTSCLPPTSATL